MIPPVDAYVTVEEISYRIAQCFRGDPEFDRIRVLGEIDNIRNLSDQSKHLYFNLMADNDQRKILEVVWFAKDRTRYSVDLEDRLQVIVEGRVTAYAQNSTYQIIASAVLPVGKDNLERDREERWRRLEKEGLFGESRKRPIPYMPEYIGVICSRTSAAFKDIERWFLDYYPSRYELIVKSVKVQGEGAAREICAAIEGMSRELPCPEVIIVARGGGAEEDLSVFDHEDVVRAAAGSVIPLISGVGHESDKTLIDFAADLRVPTPTAAAAVLQLKDRTRTGREFSSESEMEREEFPQEELTPDVHRRPDEAMERWEKTEEIANETRKNLDGLIGEINRENGKTRKPLLSVLLFFSLMAVIVGGVVLSPFSEVWPQWPEICQRYIGSSPLCK